MNCPSVVQNTYRSVEAQVGSTQGTLKVQSASGHLVTDGAMQLSGQDVAISGVVENTSAVSAIAISAGTIEVQATGQILSVGNVGLTAAGLFSVIGGTVSSKFSSANSALG